MTQTRTTKYKYFSYVVISLLSYFVLLTGIANASSQPYITDHKINFGTGNKYLTETDISIAGPGLKVTFKRTYNSQSNTLTKMGYGWTANITELLTIGSDAIHLIQADGRRVYFADNGDSTWVNTIGTKRTITSVSGNYLLTEPNGSQKLFDNSGRLLTDTDHNGNNLTYSYTGDDLSTIASNFGQTLSFSYSDGKLISITSATGTTSYTYDSNNNLKTITKPDASLVQYIYDDPSDIHNLTGIINEEGLRILTVEYDADDRAINSALEGGFNAVSIEYNGLWQRTIIDSLGVSTSYQLTAQNGMVIVSSYAGPGCSSCGSGADESYTYTDRNRIASSTNAAGMISAFTYDERGNKLTITQAQGTPLETTTTKTYTTDNRPETITVDSVANPGHQSITNLSYDTNGNLLSRTVSGYSGTAPISNTISYSYNSDGQLITIDGPRTDVNDITTLTYYPNESAEGLNRGQLHTVQNALGHSVTYSSYNHLGLAENIIDANGVMTTRSYDNSGRLTATTLAGLITDYSYDKTGALLQVASPNGYIINYSYDASGHVASITDNQGNAYNYSYDSRGQQIAQQIQDPAGDLKQFIDFEYTDTGYLAKTLLPGGAEKINTYNNLGNIIATINANGIQTDMAYDELNRLLSVTKAGETVAYTYDSNNNITQITDAAGTPTTYTYDDLGRKISRSAPDTGTTSYSYDQAGNLKSVTDALTRTVTTEFDELNRPIQLNYDDQSTEFRYDESTDGTGRLTSISDEHGSRTLQYNAVGQVITDSRDIGTSPYTTSYSYSPGTGELDSITYPSGKMVSYTRAVDGRITSLLIDGTEQISAVSRLPFGPITTATLGAVNLNKDYDQRYNLQKINAGSLTFEYSRDQEGNVLSITNMQAPSVSDTTTDYTYTSNSNQLMESTGSITRSYVYDAVGNTVSDGISNFSYDGLNRLTMIERDGSVIATYGYDTNNRRIFKTTETQTTHYHYDLNSQLIAETQSDGTPVRDYFYIDGELVAAYEYQDNPGLYYYLNDHLGTPQQIVDSSGNIVWQAAYLPFGKAQVQTEIVSNNIRFPGQYFDVESGLHYNWHRFYDPETGRYTSADPIGLAGGINLYAYVLNDPVNLVDPWGLFGQGGPSSSYPGHNDFSGGSNGRGRFDYSIEDEGDTSPWVDPERHFRPLGQSERDVQEAINQCNEDAFRRAMHRGQDYFSHYEKGYRWAPFQTVTSLGFGHLFDGTTPDEDPVAWFDAETWSYQWNKKWKEHCECKNP